MARGLAATAFVGAGIAKVGGSAHIAENFARWGFPAFFMTLVGLCELAGAIGLLAPRLRFWAAGGLVALMMGAVGTHLVHGEVSHVGPPLFLLVLTAVLAWLERPTVLRSRKSAPSPQAS